MDKLFNPDNVVWRTIRRIVQLAGLSILWLLCCIPVITIGPSTAALYYATVKSVRRDRSYPFREYWRGWKINCRKGMNLTVILLLYFCLELLLDMMIGFSIFELNTTRDYLMYLLFAVRMYFVVGTALHIFPLLSRFDNHTLRLFGTAMYFCVRYFGQTVILIFIGGVMVVLAMILTDGSMFYLALFLPAICFWLMSLVLEPIYKKYYEEQRDESSNIDDWYAE